MQFDVDAIRSGLSAYSVLARYQLDVRRRARDEVEGAVCPARADHNRPTFVLNTETGLWRCFSCNTSGDLIALVMGHERKDFAEVLPILAELAGVTPGKPPDPAEQARRREQRNLRETAARQAQANSRANAIAKATKLWESLPLRHPEGEAYLARRGLPITGNRWALRFLHGNPALALRTADDQVVNVVQRRVDGSEPKVLGLKDCPTAGTFVHALTDLEPNGTAVLAEGFFDSLTAAFAWPGARVLGAHGASNMERIAAAAAPRIRELGGRLLVVPHDDGAGARPSLESARAAIAAGLVNGIDLRVVDLGEHKDLNDAWCAGWRP